MENKGTVCQARTVLENDLISATMKAFQQMLTDKQNFLNELMESIREGLKDKCDRSLFEIEEELEKLQLQLIDRTSSQEDYADLVEKIYQLKDEKSRLLKEEAGQKVHQKNLAAIENFVKDQDVEELEFEDKLVRQFIEEIIVKDEVLEFHFTTGTKVIVEE